MIKTESTTGIPYKKGEKEMGMEIIKQMYDIGCLCDHADNSEIVASVFSAFSETEIQYRENTCTVSDVLTKINKRQDDLIRFIRHFEEKELNPMIRATHSIIPIRKRNSQFGNARKRRKKAEVQANEFLFHLENKGICQE